MYKLVKFAISSVITSLRFTQFCLMLMALLTMIDFILTLMTIELPSYIQIVFDYIYAIQNLIYKPNLSIIPVDFTLVVAAIEMLILAGLMVYVHNFVIEFEQVLDKVQKDSNRRFEQKFNKQLEKNAVKIEALNKQFALLYDVEIEKNYDKYAYENKPIDTNIKIVEYRSLFRTTMTQNFKVVSQQLTNGTLLFFENINDCNEVFNKIYEFSKLAQQTLKPLNVKFKLKTAVCIANKNDSKENFVPKLKKLLNIAQPNKIMALGDFKNKYTTLKEQPYKINGIGEYSLNNETIDVYTLEP